MNFSPVFKTTVLILGLIVWFVFNMSEVRADTYTFTPYASLGAGKLDCNLTDRMICDNPKMGSETPGYIEAGLILEPSRPVFFLLYADQIDIGWRHQSYVNRGYLLPGMDFGGQEAQMDAYAVNFIWKFKKLSFTLGE